MCSLWLLTGVAGVRDSAVWADHRPDRRRRSRGRALSNTLTERLKVPVPALIFIAAAAAVKVIPALLPPDSVTVERLVTVALLCILFGGSMHIGWTRFRHAAVPIGVVGVLGTFLTTAGAAHVLHAGFDLDWYPALLIATAIAPIRSGDGVSYSFAARSRAAAPSSRVNPGGLGRDRADGEPACRRQPQWARVRSHRYRIRRVDGNRCRDRARRWPGTAVVHAPDSAAERRLLPVTDAGECLAALCRNHGCAGLGVSRGLIAGVVIGDARAPTSWGSAVSMRRWLAWRRSSRSLRSG
jgi:hypothetical protein